MKKKAGVETRRAILALAVMLIAAAVGTSSAFAGEITGNGKPTAAPDNANSECSFSGWTIRTRTASCTP